MDDLLSELGVADAPAWLARLTTVERAALLARIRELRADRRTELRAAIDRALEQVPWLLRAALKKVLFP